MRVLAILALVAAVAFAADVARVEGLGGGAPSDDELSYYDTTPSWYTWGGVYRGSWFNAVDFYGMETGVNLYQTEFWFYHGTYPWDTSDCYIHIFNGDEAGPVSQLDQTQVTAIHYSPTTVDYTDISTENDFWVVINTELSSGGWPSILGDDTPNTVDHSFFSDDLIVWDPWVIYEGSPANDYALMCSDAEASLDEATWGSIKALY